MGQDELVKALEEESRAEVARIIGEAEIEAAATLSRAAERSGAASGSRAGFLRDELVKKKTAAINLERNIARGKALTLKRALIKEAEDEAIKSIMTGGDYSAVLNVFYDELLATTAEDNPTILVNPADTKLIKSSKARITPDETVKAGVVYLSKDRTFRSENSLPARLEKLRKVLTPRLAKILFDAD
ncbi:MAG: V-type ATP synthase subunit E [Thermodesulfobacteriota bacterium]